MNSEKKEVIGREVKRKEKIAQARQAYRLRKVWDFNRLGKEEVIDTSRLMDRKPKGK